MLHNSSNKMKVLFTFVGLDSTPSIETYVSEKLASIEKLLEHLDPGGAAELRLELARTTHHHHKGLVYRASAHLKLPKKSFQAEAEGEDIRAAFDMLKNKLHNEVERYKDFLVSQERRKK